MSLPVYIIQAVSKSVANVLAEPLWIDVMVFPERAPSTDVVKFHHAMKEREPSHKFRIVLLMDGEGMD